MSCLIAAILVASCKNIRKINGNGVKKMCRNIFSLQHTLSSNLIGSRETYLDRTRVFYELFNQRPQVRILLFIDQREKSEINRPVVA